MTIDLALRRQAAYIRRLAAARRGSTPFQQRGNQVFHAGELHTFDTDQEAENYALGWNLTYQMGADVDTYHDHGEPDEKSTDAP